MNDVKLAVEKIEEIDFFHSTGTPCKLATSLSIQATQSWAKAIDMRGTNTQSNAFLEAKNIYTTILGLNYRKEYRNWNRIVEDAHEFFGSQVFPRMETAVDSIEELESIENGAAFLKHSISWDLVGAAVEFAYSDIVPTGFSTLMLQVYEAGHFPCGWDRGWPDGKLWVY